MDDKINNEELNDELNEEIVEEVIEEVIEETVEVINKNGPVKVKGRWV